MSGSGSKAVAVRLSVEGAEQVKAALVRLGEDGKAALAKLNFDTSSAAGPRLFQSALQEASAEANGMTGALGPLGAILGNVGGAYLAAGAAAGTFAGLIEKSGAAAEEQEQVQRRIAAVLEATGGASGETGASIEAMATRISSSTLQTKQDVENAAAELATFKNVGPEAFERTIQAAADMAAVFGGDLSSNVSKLGLALDDPIKGMDRLRRSGLDLSPAQKEIITNLQETGNLAGAQSALLDNLAQKMGGAGASQHEGLAGAAHDAGQAWHEFLVELDGTTGAGTGAATILDALANKLKAIGQNPVGALTPFGLGYLAQGVAQHYAPQVDLAPGGQPFHVTPANDGSGPGRAAQDRQDELGQALDDSLKDLIQEGSQVGARQRFIDQKLQAIAKANETTVAGLQTQQPQKYSALVSAAGKDYDSEHADEASKKQLEDANQIIDSLAKSYEDSEKNAADQKKTYADLAVSAASSYTQMKSAQDALLVHQLEGQTGYFAAVKQQNDDLLADQLAAIEADEQKQIADLDAKKLTYQQYQDDLTQIQQAAQDKRAAAQSENAGKNFDNDRAQQGALGPDIKKGAEDTNQALKGVAADGLNDLETGFLNVVRGTESVSQAFKSMVASILEDIAKLVLEKQVIAPLANLLNGMIDGTGSGSAGGGSGGGAASGFASFIGSLFSASANGNVFDHGSIRAFANGGIVDNSTLIPMALMGEAGPEAVVPLARGSNGKLGIAGGSGGDVHNHFSPTINFQGGNDDQIAALREELNNQKRDFFANSVQAFAQARSRRIIPG